MTIAARTEPSRVLTPSDHDPDRFARGVVNALCFSLGLWALIGVLVALVLTLT